MAVPTYDRFIDPVLRYLVLHPAGVRARDAYDAAADAMGLSESDRALTVPSGEPLYKNRAAWAHDRLKRAGLSRSPKRGTWLITEQGREFVAAHPHALSAEDIRKLALGYLEVRLRPGALGATLEAQEASTLIATQSPDDRLQIALQEIRASVRTELLELMGRMSPTYFETVVLDLLHRLGYGASREDLQRVGGSGDAGIDGVISLDKLGLEKVYVQAKRWQGTVGRPEVQGFYGALAGQRANKGVFITTSAFTAQAVAFAGSVERIVLIDGNALTNLMMDNEVGISSQALRIPKIDSDYFDE